MAKDNCSASLLSTIPFSIPAWVFMQQFKKNLRCFDMFIFYTGFILLQNNTTVCVQKESLKIPALALLHAPFRISVFSEAKLAFVGSVSNEGQCDPNVFPSHV